MKRVPRGEGIYATSAEGVDNDGDGRINEDGIGGLDLHRNYPENWRPERELTGRGFTQRGAGEYPLSEPETRAVFTFLMTHPNIYVVNSMDTTVPMHLRPPSTSPSEERMYPEDLKWYRYFDALAGKITGYEKQETCIMIMATDSPCSVTVPTSDTGITAPSGMVTSSGTGAGQRIMTETETRTSLTCLHGMRRQTAARVSMSGSLSAIRSMTVSRPEAFIRNSSARILRPAHLETWAQTRRCSIRSLSSHLPRLEWEEFSVKR
jgi:hypothetical protein